MIQAHYRLFAGFEFLTAYLAWAKIMMRLCYDYELSHLSWILVPIRIGVVSLTAFPILTFG
jgi:hypothetical protein